MADIVGRIGPALDITETPAWDAPAKCLFVEDGYGRLHGQIQWLASEVDEAFLDKLSTFCGLAIKERSTSRSPFRAS